MPVRFSRVAVLAFSLVAAGAARAETVTIDQQVFTAPKGTITLKNVQAVDSSLSRDDLIKLFSPATPDVERAALLKAFKATKLTIPSIEVKDGKSVVAIRDVAADKIDSGRVAKLTVAGADASSGDDFKLKANALTLEDGDFSSLAPALVTGDVKQFAGRVGAARFDGLTATVREDGPKDKVGFIDLAIGGAESRTTMEGDVPKAASFSVRNMVVAPQKGAKMARDLSAFGYEKLDLGVKGAVAYDIASKGFSLDDLTIDGVNAGALTLAAKLGNVDKTFGSSDAAQRFAAFMGADLSQLTIKFADAGLMDRALAYAAGKGSKEGMRAEWAKAAGQYVPVMLGGDAGALAIAAEVQKFINSPKNLTITATGKAGPVRLLDLPGLKDPSELLKRIDLKAIANQ
jgi:hypothetical protein